MCHCITLPPAPRTGLMWHAPEQTLSPTAPLTHPRRTEPLALASRPLLTAEHSVFSQNVLPHSLPLPSTPVVCASVVCLLPCCLLSCSFLNPILLLSLSTQSYPLGLHFQSQRHLQRQIVSLAGYWTVSSGLFLVCVAFPICSNKHLTFGSYHEDEPTEWQTMVLGQTAWV